MKVPTRACLLLGRGSGSLIAAKQSENAALGSNLSETVQAGDGGDYRRELSVRSSRRAMRRWSFDTAKAGFAADYGLPPCADRTNREPGKGALSRGSTEMFQNHRVVLVLA